MTGTAAVLAAISVNTTTATTSSPSDRCAAPIVAARPQAHQQVLRISPDSANPRPSALPK